jgi:diacylglycerol kinase (ATP)
VSFPARHPGAARELVTSAIEVVADAVTADDDPMLGRAKDLGGAAVMVSLVTAVAVWTLALWP